VPAPQLPHRLPDLDVISVDPMGGERLAQVERLAGVEHIVGSTMPRDALR